MSIIAQAQAGVSSGESTVLNIQRMSTEDGPGLRTTVFLKGCSLECGWCHNPEAVSVKPQVVWHARACIASRACDAACGDDAIIRTDSAEIRIDFSRCTLCGKCVQDCPSAALELIGTQWDVDDLLQEVAKDESYFETSGGGVTISGGEPGLWPSCVTAFIEACKARGYHTAVDTSGMCSPAALKAIASRADLVLYDLKQMDSEKHRDFTGQPNERILSNLQRLAVQMREGGGPTELWIRTPLIPGATADERNIRAVGEFISAHLEGLVSRWELCSFNNLAGDKYRRLGRSWTFEGTGLMTPEQLLRCKDWACRSLRDASIVIATGRTRIECAGDSVRESSS